MELADLDPFLIGEEVLVVFTGKRLSGTYRALLVEQVEQLGGVDVVRIKPSEWWDENGENHEGSGEWWTERTYDHELIDIVSITPYVGPPRSAWADRVQEIIARFVKT